MTCDDFRMALDAYRSGSLDDARSSALESHAAGCAACEGLLEAAMAGRLPAFAPPLPATLRADVLHAVAERRRAQRTGRWTRTGIAIAAAALAVIMLRPTSKSAQLVIADTTAVPAIRDDGGAASADALAHSEFRALDDAARELQAALARTPGDAELAAFLRSVNDQRAALRRQVQDAES